MSKIVYFLTIFCAVLILFLSEFTINLRFNS